MSPAAAHAAADVRAPRAIAIIPARLASQRLPRKMLLRAAGRALFAHTAHNVARAGAFARVVVATDSAEITDEARREGLEACLTRADHASGTDRAAEAWRILAAAGERADVVVDVQGDEPELDPRDLAALVDAFADPAVEAATLAAPLDGEAERELATIVKVVADRRGDALYFSRAPIPCRGHARESPRASDASAHADRDRERTREGDLAVHRRHVGVYAFRPEALLRFCELPRGVLEAHENLEQLRWLEAGRKMRVVAASRAPQGIDTMHDFEQFVARASSAGSP
jgi:3-deoxy-manno-octulosonate cytidylyltransferase (CMP-KDO synthetase)